MLRLSVYLVTLLLASSLNADANTYYVAQSSGNDSNNGTSAATAWKNSPGMSSYAGSGSLSPGDVVYFDRGGTWLVTGTQGLYLAGGVTYIGDTWGTGTRAIIKASADIPGGVVRFKDHATLPTIFQGFDVDSNRTVSTGIDINHGFFASPLTGATKRVQNCVVHNVASLVSQGQYSYGIIVSDHGGAAGAVANVEILDSIVHDVSRDAICLYPGDESADCTIKNITVRGSEAYNTGLDPDYCCGAGLLVKGHVQDAYLEYNYAHDDKGASVFINGNETNTFAGSGPTNIHIRYNILTNATVNGAIRIYDGTSTGDPKDIKVYGNIVYNSTVNGGLQIGSDLKNTLSLLVYNNIFYNAPVIINSNNATVSTFEFKNNIVSYSGGTALSDAGYITAHSNNIYSGGGTLVSARGTNYNSGNLSAYEPSASSSDPLFTNALNLPTGFSGTYGLNLTPNKDGMRAKATSFAVGHGLALASTYAGSINTVTRSSPWDIGPYKLTGGAPSAPTNLKITAWMAWIFQIGERVAHDWVERIHGPFVARKTEHLRPASLSRPTMPSSLTTAWFAK